MTKFWSVLFGLSILACSALGCRSSSGGPAEGVVLERSASVYVMPVADAANADDNTHLASGAAANSAIRECLLSRGCAVANDPDKAIYVLVAKYTRWEDHATQWNGDVDVVTLSLELQTAGTKDTVSLASGTAKGSWFTLVNDRPSRLIPTAVSDGVARLYGDRQ